MLDMMLDLGGIFTPIGLDSDRTTVPYGISRKGIKQCSKYLKENIVFPHRHNGMHIRFKVTLFFCKTITENFHFYYTKVVFSSSNDFGFTTVLNKTIGDYS